MPSTQSTYIIVLNQDHLSMVGRILIHVFQVAKWVEKVGAI